jgi:hypothetical protein
METFSMLKVAFGEQVVGRTQVLLSLRVVLPLLKMLNAQYPAVSKTDENVD